MTRLRLSEAAGGATLALGAIMAQPIGAPAPAPARSGWVWGLTIVVVVAVLAVWWVLFRRQAKRFQHTYRLEISNRGNVHSQYALQASDPTGALRFVFVLGDRPLSGQGMARPEPTTAPPAPTRETAPTRPPLPEHRAGVDTIKSARGKGMRIGSNVASALDSLGDLLPRSAGAPLRRAAGQIRRGQSSVRRAEQLPGRAIQTSSQVMPRRATLQAAPGQTSARPQPVVSFRQEAITPATASQTIEQGWVETPFVEPGGTLVIDLSIDADNPYRSQTYPFVVESWALEQREDSLIVEESSVPIVKPTFLQRYSPFMVTVIVAAAIWLLARAVIGTVF
jgi:hypothetical protein